MKYTSREGQVLAQAEPCEGMGCSCAITCVPSPVLSFLRPAPLALPRLCSRLFLLVYIICTSCFYI